MQDGGARSLFQGIVRLVPWSGVQTIDVVVPREACAVCKLRFLEEALDVDGGIQHVLLPLEASPDPTPNVPKGDGDAAQRSQVAEPLYHPLTGKLVDPATVLELDGVAAINHFAGRWIPLPYLRFVGRDELQRAKFDAGPSNWVRAFVTAPETADAPAIEVTLAFDTSLDQHSRLDSSAYIAPNLDDAAFGSTFFCATGVDDVAPLLGEPWLEAWLASIEPAGPAPGAMPAPGLPPVGSHFHIAQYLTFLQLLATAGVMPEVRFIDTVQQRFPIRTTPVDLVLDIGDAETTALLVDVTPEGQADAYGDIGYAESLRLRDLTEPHLVHTGPFPTAAEFTAQPYGDTGLSRESGRIDAFNWPSLVRIGNEARRLGLRANGTEGVTGLSNLRSFLLDETASPGLWRQSTNDRRNGESSASASDQGPMVSGSVLGFVVESGALIGAEPLDPSQLLLSDQRPAIRPRFSRASMIGFFAAELVLHALAQINSAAREGRDAHESDVRELRQVVVLAPASLSHTEREALLSRVAQGLALAWRGLGWDHAAAGVPKQPVATLGLGGELGTQIAYLHNEVSAKYQGRFRDLLRVYRGGDISGSASEALRVASVDFGARATTLTIVDYASSDAAALSGEWQPSVQLQDRLPLGTDAALQALIWTLLLPAIEAHLASAGLDPARNFLDEITGRSSTSLLVEDPYFTRRLNRKVLWPAATGLFALTQHGAESLAYGNRSVSLATLVELGGGRLDGLGAAFDAAALQAGARGFTLRSTKVDLQRGEIARIVRTELQDCVHQVCRAVASNACDLLLLGGDGTRLPTLHEAVLADLPVPASRIIDLNTYQNRAAADAIGGVAITSAMLPAIASALDRRQLLEQSGFGHVALGRLALPPPSSEGTHRALGAPGRRVEASDRAIDPAAAGRIAALPAKGA